MSAVPESAASCRDARFAELVDRQTRFVYRVAYAVVRNVQDAEDVVQDTFIKLYRLDAWGDLRDERAFLARTAWRLAVGRRRARTVTMETEERACGENPEEAALAADWSARVRGMMDTLPEELRQTLALSGIEELNSREIAETMGIPEGTVRTRLARARALLKEKLGRERR